MVLVRAGLGNHVDDAAGDSTELHFVVMRLHLEFLNFVDDGGDRVGREGHFRIVNAVQHEGFRKTYPEARFPIRAAKEKDLPI